MERDRLKGLVREIKLLLDELESEVYSDKERYTYPISDYDEVFDDDDGYCD